MFFEIVVITNFRNIHRKKPVLESFFTKAAGLHACNFIKRALQHRCFPCEYCEIFKNSSGSGASKKKIRGVRNASGCKNNHSLNINQLIVFLSKIFLSFQFVH